VPACWVGLPLALLLPPPVLLALPDVELAGGVLLELLHAATVRDIAASPAAIAVTDRTLYAVRADRAARFLNMVMCF
jgi:hypothetical protein